MSGIPKVGEHWYVKEYSTLSDISEGEILGEAPYNQYVVGIKDFHCSGHHIRRKRIYPLTQILCIVPEVPRKTGFFAWLKTRLF
jgi:hypothetical protein